MCNYNTREIVTNIISDITTKSAYNNIVLKRYLNQYKAMNQKDKAFITELVNGVLRNIYYIDYIIEQFSSVKLKKIKPFILNILRISVYQSKFMDRVPESAICNEAVKLVKKRGYVNLSGFVNGILRNIIRNKDNIKLPNESTEKSKYLQVVYSYPQWIIDKWLKEYDYEFVKSMCIKNNQSPDVSICTNTLKISQSELKSRLIDKGISAKAGKYIDSCLHLSKLSNISDLKEYSDGYFHVQDESSMLAVSILDPHEGEFIIDVCAAPGGKSLMCAEKMNNKGIIKARDIYDHKLKIISEASKRLGINIIETQNMDATILDELSIRKADKVLIDAPCSGLGLVRKKADIKLKKIDEDINTLKELQKKILTVCAEYVKLDGILIYSTCTISNDENIDNINWFISKFHFELESISHLVPQGISNTTDYGYIQLFPHIHDTDGFFIARMRRKG